MRSPTPLALALLLQVSLADGVGDESVLIQRSAARNDEDAKRFYAPSPRELEKFYTYRVGDRVSLEGYDEDANITVVGYSNDRERYHLMYNSENLMLNENGKFLKRWKSPYEPSKDPQAGPIMLVRGYEYKGQPFIVRRGEKPRSWDVYFPVMGLIKNIDEIDIEFKPSWRRTSTTNPPREPKLLAVLTGKATPGYSAASRKQLASTTRPPKAASKDETIYLSRKALEQAPKTEEAPPLQVQAASAPTTAAPLNLMREKHTIPVPPYALPPYLHGRQDLPTPPPMMPMVPMADVNSEPVMQPYYGGQAPYVVAVPYLVPPSQDIGLDSEKTRSEQAVQRLQAEVSKEAKLAAKAKMRTKDKLRYLQQQREKLERENEEWLQQRRRQMDKHERDLEWAAAEGKKRKSTVEMESALVKQVEQGQANLDKQQELQKKLLEEENMLVKKHNEQRSKLQKSQEVMQLSPEDALIEKNILLSRQILESKDLAGKAIKLREGLSKAAPAPLALRRMLPDSADPPKDTLTDFNRVKLLDNRTVQMQKIASDRKANQSQVKTSSKEANQRPKGLAKVIIDAAHGLKKNVKPLIKDVIKEGKAFGRDASKDVVAQTKELKKEVKHTLKDMKPRRAKHRPPWPFSLWSRNGEATTEEEAPVEAAEEVPEVAAAEGASAPDEAEEVSAATKKEDPSEAMATATEMAGPSHETLRDKDVLLRDVPLEDVTLDDVSLGNASLEAASLEAASLTDASTADVSLEEAPEEKATKNPAATGTPTKTGNETEQEMMKRLAAPAKDKAGRKLVTLDLSSRKAGLHAEQYQGGYKEKMLRLTGIDSVGAAARWNMQHPFEVLMPGERILQVNGKGGNSQKLAEMLRGAIKEKKKLHLLVEKVGPTFEEGMNQVLKSSLFLAHNGPREFLREKLPYKIGHVFLNKAKTVSACKDISSALLCSESQKRFRIECAGWGGSSCLSKEEVTCGLLTTELICRDSHSKFGVQCAGWGGSSCLTKTAHPNEITDPEICTHAEKRLGILVAGWGGKSCLERDAPCSKIKLPGLCNSADVKLGMTCLGWGGSSCLAPGSKASFITKEHLCKGSLELFGIESSGWSGKGCLGKQELTCSAIKDPAVCADSEKRLGITCAGWGGSSCLAPGAHVNLITADSICQHSVDLLGIPSGGWSGARCLPAGDVRCRDIERPGVCNSAKSRLGLDCAGWSGTACLAPKDFKCSLVVVRHICETAADKFNTACVWNGDVCLPEAAPRR